MNVSRLKQFDWHFVLLLPVIPLILFSSSISAQENRENQASGTQIAEDVSHRSFVEGVNEYVYERWTESVPVLQASTTLADMVTAQSDRSRSEMRLLMDGGLDNDSRTPIGKDEQVVINLPGNGKATIERAAFLLWNKRGDRGTITLEVKTDTGNVKTLGTVDQGEHSNRSLHVFEFEPISVKQVRLRSAGEGERRIGELFLFEPDRSNSVVSNGGANLAARADNGCVFYTTQTTKSVVNLIDGKPDSGASLEPAKGQTVDVVFSFRGNGSAHINEIELVPERNNGEPNVGKLPVQMEVFLSSNDPFRSFQSVGTFDIERTKQPQTFSLDKPMEIRFVRVRFKTNTGDEMRLGQVRIREASPPDYQSLLIRKTNYIWKWTRPKTNLDDSFEELKTVDEQEANDTPENGRVLKVNEWVQGKLASKSDKDLYKVELNHDPEQQMPRLNLRMVPFLRSRIRVLTPSGDVVRTINPSELDGTNTSIYLPLDPGTYFLELTNAPDYMMVGYDTSSSLSGTFSTSRSAIMSWAEALPESFHISLANSICSNADGICSDSHCSMKKCKGPCYKIACKFTSSAETIKNAAKEKKKDKDLFYAPPSTSSWYTVIAQLLDYTGENVPDNGVGSFTFLADGNGTGNFQNLWRKMRRHRMRMYTIGYGDVGEKLDEHTSWDGSRGLFNLAWYQGGIYFQPQSHEELVSTYETIFDDLKAAPRYAARVRVRKRKPGTVTSRAPIGEQRPYLFILDCSGSMRMELDGKKRIDIAKDVVSQVVQSMPPNWKVGLRVYGHRYTTLKQEKAKTDSELILPINTSSGSKFQDVLSELRPLGGTPLAYSLKQAANDVSGLNKPNVIVLTDGEEGFQKDPAEAAATLAGAADGIELNVVGFAIGDQAGRRNLEAMTKAGNGTYYSATDAESLMSAMKTSIRPKVPYTIETPDGETVAEGALGDSHTLKEGAYVVKFDETTRNITVRPDRTTRIQPPSNRKE